MSAPNITADAVVRFVVEVSNSGGNWGGDCTVSQAYRQAEASALDELRKTLGSSHTVRIVRVEAVDVVIRKVGS